MKKTRHSEKTGKFVSKEFAKDNPETTVEVTNREQPRLINDKTKVFIDLSKLSEEQQKHIISLLPDCCWNGQYVYNAEFAKHLKYNSYHQSWVTGLFSNDKRLKELTYPEFIKLFEGGEGEKKKAANFVLGQIDKAIENAKVEDIKDIAHTEGVLVGLRICKELWAQGTISHEAIQEEIYYYQEELDNLNSNQ